MGERTCGRLECVALDAELGSRPANDGRVWHRETQRDTVRHREETQRDTERRHREETQRESTCGEVRDGRARVDRFVDPLERQRDTERHSETQ